MPISCESNSASVYLCIPLHYFSVFLSQRCVSFCSYLHSNLMLFVYLFTFFISVSITRVFFTSKHRNHFLTLLSILACVFVFRSFTVGLFLCLLRLVRLLHFSFLILSSLAVHSITSLSLSLSFFYFLDTLLYTFPSILFSLSLSFFSLSFAFEKEFSK